MSFASFYFYLLSSRFPKLTEQFYDNSPWPTDRDILKELPEIKDSDDHVSIFTVFSLSLFIITHQFNFLFFFAPVKHRQAQFLHGQNLANLKSNENLSDLWEIGVGVGAEVTATTTQPCAYGSVLVWSLKFPCSCRPCRACKQCDGIVTVHRRLSARIIFLFISVLKTC